MSERRAWLTWEDILAGYAYQRSLGDSPETATLRARRLVKVGAPEPFEFTGETYETDRRIECRALRGKGGRRARIGVITDDLLDDLAEAFWRGAEPTLAKRHPDLITKAKRRP